MEVSQMNDEDKTKQELISKLNEMHLQLDEMKKSESETGHAQSTIQISETRYRRLFETAQAVAFTLEKNVAYKAGHHLRVTNLAFAIGTEMNLTSDQLDGIRIASMIHDIGKKFVPAALLSKTTRLTDSEFQVMKTHVLSGYDILKDIDFPWQIARMVLEHHERMNGSGYPNGLTGDNLLMESRILSVADVVDAIASHRPYRPAWGINVAMYDIKGNRGMLYDTEVVDVCLRLFHEKGYKISDD
jgi:HD-GYP domain-containing protein (c-di-GMP phosphodiesterase class II)